jgi:hypothetical protein
MLVATLRNLEVPDPSPPKRNIMRLKTVSTSTI